MTADCNYVNTWIHIIILVTYSLTTCVGTGCYMTYIHVLHAADRFSTCMFHDVTTFNMLPPSLWHTVATWPLYHMLPTTGLLHTCSRCYHIQHAATFSMTCNTHKQLTESSPRAPFQTFYIGFIMTLQYWSHLLQPYPVVQSKPHYQSARALKK